jgi:alpha-ketoglutarate-dependent taurine dioxygenase
MSARTDLSDHFDVSNVGTGAGGLTVLTARGEDADLVKLGQDARSAVEARLLQDGALVFRGLRVEDPARLDRFSHAISPETPQFAEESSPRSQVAGAVYTSTDYPKDYPIQFHNEYSYAAEWPMKIYFGCAVPAAERGATPVADSRRVLARLRPETRERFAKRKVLYVRNFIEQLGVSWQTAFRTDDKSAVERYCEAAGIEWSWATDRFTTRQVRDAIVRHPRSGEAVWFNHGWFFNVASLEPEKLRAYFQRQPEDTLSTQTYYGDGERFEPEVLEELRAAYAAEARRFDWQRGDVLLIDNMLTSHGREPYAGPRKILCVMADPCRRDSLVRS